MLTSGSLIALVNKDARIGIGLGADRTKVLRSGEEAKKAGFSHVSMYEDPLLMAQDLRDGRIDAAIRGDFESNRAMAAVREAFGLNKVLRAAFMEPQGGRMFLLAPVGIDEGWTMEEKLELARRGQLVLGRLGIRPVIGIMSGGRSSDKGRMEAVDRTIDDAQAVVDILRREGTDARDVQILIENGAAECDMLIAPDGISGNLVFRTLHFLGGGKALGAPVLNIDRVYIDTSRAKESYLDSIYLAAALTTPPSGRVTDQQQR
jgi:putative methanogen marker protein 4